MDCKRFRVEIEEAGAGATPGAGVAAHLDTCGGCRTFGAERAALRGLVAGLPRVDAPNDFEFRLRARLAAEGPRRARAGRPSFVPRGAWAAAVAGCLLLAFGVSLWLRQPTPAGAGDVSQASQIATATQGSPQDVRATPQGARTDEGSASGSSESTAAGAGASGTPVEVANGAGTVGAGTDTAGTGPVVERETNVERRPSVRRARRQTHAPRGATEEVALGGGAATDFEEHSRSVIGGTVIALPLPAEEGPLQVTFKDMRGTSRVVKVDPVAFGSREPSGAGVRVVKASHKQGVW